MSASFDAVPLGARVVVRSRLDPRHEAPHDGPSMTDAVGTLLSRSATEVVVATRHGDVTIARDRVVAAKEVPPRPSRRGAAHRALSVADLQRVMVGAWPPMERSTLGDWLLHASRGFTGRGNSTLPLGDPGRPLEAALAAVEDWYAARDLPSTFMLAGPVAASVAHDPVGAALLERDYAEGARTLTLTASAARVRASTGPADRVELSPLLTDAWLDTVRGRRAVDEEAARAILQGSPEQLFASVVEEGHIVATGRLGLAGGWGGVAAMWVEERSRRQGLASAVLGTLAAQAEHRGVRSLHLQVETSNAAARGLYERHGFEPHHAYTYLTSSRGACR